MRRRIGDRRILALVKTFLKAGVLGEDQVERDTVTGTPQGGILSPLLANIALSVLDSTSWGSGSPGAAKTAAAGGVPRVSPTTASSGKRTTSSCC